MQMATKMTEETRLPKLTAPEFAGERIDVPCDPSSVAPDRRLTLTSHSLKIDVGLFTIDLSWRRLEMDPQQSGRTEDLVRKPSPAIPGFAEILRRQQIADLLAPVSRPPAGCELLQAGGQVLPPMIPVRLAYPDKERPLAGLRSLRPLSE